MIFTIIKHQLCWGITGSFVCFQGNQGSPGPQGSRQKFTFPSQVISSWDLAREDAHWEALHLVLPINIGGIKHNGQWRPLPIISTTRCFFQLQKWLWENFPESFWCVRAILITGLYGWYGKSILRECAFLDMGTQLYKINPRRQLFTGLMSIYSNSHDPHLTFMIFFLCKAQSVSWMSPY